MQAASGLAAAHRQGPRASRREAVEHSAGRHASNAPCSPTSAWPARSTTPASRTPAWSPARRTTCRPNRRRASRSTSAPTCSASARAVFHGDRPSAVSGATGAMAVLHRICHDTHRPVWQRNAEIPDELSDFDRPAAGEETGQAVYQCGRSAAASGGALEPAAATRPRAATFSRLARNKRLRKYALMGTASTIFAAAVTITLSMLKTIRHRRPTRLKRKPSLANRTTRP